MKELQRINKKKETADTLQGMILKNKNKFRVTQNFDATESVSLTIA